MPKFLIEFDDENEFNAYSKAKDNAAKFECLVDDIHHIARPLNKHGETLEQFQQGMESIAQLSWPDSQPFLAKHKISSVLIGVGIGTVACSLVNIILTLIK
jgi:hypothetical protein